MDVLEDLKMSFLNFSFVMIYTTIKDTRNLFRKKKKLKIEYLEILEIFLSIMKKKKIIINQ